jgi:hypothetical protein
MRERAHGRGGGMGGGNRRSIRFDFHVGAASTFPWSRSSRGPHGARALAIVAGRNGV